VEEGGRRTEASTSVLILWRSRRDPDRDLNVSVTPTPQKIEGKLDSGTKCRYIQHRNQYLVGIEIVSYNFSRKFGSNPIPSNRPIRVL
jgi:hypothetical protein